MKSQQLLVTGISLMFLIKQCQAQDAPMSPSNHEVLAKAKTLFEANQCFPKGGLGIIAKRIYVVLDATQNELKIPDGKDWVGRSKTEKEAVIIFGGRVFSTSDLPSDYRLNESILASFEAEKVIFFDFRTLGGGFYRRD